MRFIFYTLLLINIAYFGYNFVDSERAEIETPDLLASKPAIRLLSEGRGRSARDLEVQEILENPVTFHSVLDAGGCLGLGPFEDIISAQSISERLEAVGAAVELRALDEPTGDFDYQVVIPPLPSLQEAFRKLRELKSRDISSYVITDGVDAQGVSLGIFADQIAAEAGQERLKAEGYEVVIKQIPRMNRGYWIYGDSDADFPSSALSSVRNEFSSVSLTRISCLN